MPLCFCYPYSVHCFINNSYEEERSVIQETMEYLSRLDPEVGASIQEEFARQRRNIELIASENIVSEAVMLAMGTCLLYTSPSPRD